MDPVTTADPKVTAVVQDAIDDVTLGTALVALYKKGGVNAVLPELPRVIGSVQKNIADVTAAIPVIKAGYKTSEFWLATGSVAVLAVIPVFTHQPPSAAVVSVVGVIASVYAVVRGMVKGTTPTPAATVTPSAK